MNSLSLREQHAALVADTTNWYNKAKENPELNEHDVHAEFDKRMGEAEALKKKIAQAERSERLEAANAELAQSVGRKTAPTQPSIRENKTITRAARNSAMKHWLGYGLGLESLKYDGETMMRCADAGFNLSNAAVHVPCVRSSVNTLTGGAGGDATFTTTSSDLETEMKYYSPIVSSVNLQVTKDGNNFVIPRGTDVSRLFTVMTQGDSTGYVTTPPTFDKVTLGAYYYRGVVEVSFEMLEDSVFDVEAWINQQLAEGAARTIESVLVKGSGSGEGTGLITAATSAGNVYTLAAGKKAFDSFDQLDSTAKLVDKAYRDRGTFVFHDSSFWDLRGIKDSNGRYIWDNNINQLVSGAPNRIREYNYIVSNSIDASGSFSKKIACFADLNRMVLRMVDSVRMTRINELYRANGLIGLECLLRFSTAYRGHNNSIAYTATPVS